MIRLQELELVFGHMHGPTDGYTEEHRRLCLCILDVSEKFLYEIIIC